jgi:hypothetical protein
MSPVPEFHMGSQSRVQLREDKWEVMAVAAENWVEFRS